jgi:hypothetical protein
MPPIHVINRRDELMARVARAPRETLVLSQCAQRSLYDARLSEMLVNMGAIVVPGPLTAPDGPLSNKEKTYEFLNDGGGNSENQTAKNRAAGKGGRMTAPYQALSVDGRVARITAEAIIDKAEELGERWGNTTFFVKPQQGGGGRCRGASHGAGSGRVFGRSRRRREPKEMDGPAHRVGGRRGHLCTRGGGERPGANGHPGPPGNGSTRLSGTPTSVSETRDGAPPAKGGNTISSPPSRRLSSSRGSTCSSR